MPTNLEITFLRKSSEETSPNTEVSSERKVLTPASQLKIRKYGKILRMLNNNYLKIIVTYSFSFRFPQAVEYNSCYGDSYCVDAFVGQLVSDRRVYSDGVKAKHSTIYIF